MNRAEKRAELESYRSLVLEIDGIEKELRRLKNRLLSFSLPPKGLNKEISKTEKLLSKKLCVLNVTRRKIEATLYGIKDPTARYILRAKYIDGKKFFQIGAEVGYSPEQVKRIHRKALDRLKIEGRIIYENKESI